MCLVQCLKQPPARKAKSYMLKLPISFNICVAASKQKSSSHPCPDSLCPGPSLGGQTSESGLFQLLRCSPSIVYCSSEEKEWASSTLHCIEVYLGGQTERVGLLLEGEDWSVNHREGLSHACPCRPLLSTHTHTLTHTITYTRTYIHTKTHPHKHTRKMTHTNTNKQTWCHSTHIGLVSYMFVHDKNTNFWCTKSAIIFGLSG